MWALPTPHSAPEEWKLQPGRVRKASRPPWCKRQETLWARVRGAMGYDVADSRVEDAIKVIQKEFVDLNELRVATELEVQEMLGSRYPRIEERGTMSTSALHAIFEKEHTLSLDRLKTLSRRDARHFLHRRPDMPPFPEASFMRIAPGRHAQARQSRAARGGASRGAGRSA